MSGHENQNKKLKKWRYVYRKFGITEIFITEDSQERNQIRVMEVKKLHTEIHYGGSNIFLLESRAHAFSLLIYISFFTIYSESSI